MRTAYNNVQFIVENGVFKGISLGFDFCAEHECGIKGLLHKFNVEKKLGFKKALSNPFSIVKSDDTYIMYSTHPSRIVDVTATTRFYEGINSMWDESNIQITFEKSNVNLELVKQFDGMVVNKDVSIGTHSSGFGSALCLLKYSLIPKEHIVTAKVEEAKFIQARKDFQKSKGFKALEQAKKDFYKEQLFDMGHYVSCTPFDDYYLDVHRNNNGLWLNPKHQAFLNSGWITDQDLVQWAKGEQGKIIKNQNAFNYLRWECAMGAWSVMYNKHHYTYIEPSKYMTWELGKGAVPGKLLKLIKGKRTKQKTEEIFNMIEAYVKAEIMYYMGGVWQYYNKTPLPIESFPKGDSGKPLLPFVSNLSKKSQGEIEGFLYGVGTLGLALDIFDAHGYSNTPEIKSNWAWWKNVIKAEVEYKMWVDCGLIPEPYCDKEFTYKTLHNK